MWTTLAGGAADVRCATSFRTWYFAIQPGWCQRFVKDASTHVNGVTVLQNAAFMAGGLVAEDAQHAAAFIYATLRAVLFYDGNDLDQGQLYAAELVEKMDRRPEVFSGHNMMQAREALEDLRERALMKRFVDDDDDAVTAFDPFVEVSEKDEAEPIADEVAEELANEFFDALTR